MAPGESLSILYRNLLREDDGQSRVGFPDVDVYLCLLIVCHDGLCLEILYSVGADGRGCGDTVDGCHQFGGKRSMNAQSPRRTGTARGVRGRVADRWTPRR